MGAHGTSLRYLPQAMTPLLISVIIPTLNCRAQLERHLDACKDWFPKVGQIIAIDSNSTDGTILTSFFNCPVYGVKSP